MNPCGPLQVDHVSYSHGSRTGYQKDHKLGCAKYSKHIVLVQKFQAAAALILNDMFALCLHSICHIAYITLIYAHVAPPKKICCRKSLHPQDCGAAFQVDQLATGIAKPGCGTLELGSYLLLNASVMIHHHSHELLHHLGIVHGDSFSWTFNQNGSLLPCTHTSFSHWNLHLIFFHLSFGSFFQGLDASPR